MCCQARNGKVAVVLAEPPAPSEGADNLMVAESLQHLVDSWGAEDVVWIDGEPDA